MAQVMERVDVCVVGAGHAGCEAALACARMGLETVIFTVSADSIALMPCNPNIGGSSKGHLVREVDALGGEMGKNIDKTFIQSKMLNVSKGLQFILCARRPIRRNIPEACGRFWKIRTILPSNRLRSASFLQRIQRTKKEKEE